MGLDDPPPTFAALLRRSRQAAGLTQEELAERAHLSARGINDLERGVRRAPRKDTVRLLADALALGIPERAAFESAARRRLVIQGAGTESPGPDTPTRPPLAPYRQTGPVRPGNLPLSLTSFVGREREQAALRQALTETRLLTLTGSGGCGKTRLTLQVAATLSPSYPDGIWLIELAALSDPSLVSQAAATVLGVREMPGRPVLTSLIGFLRSRRLLLLLDNCEHLVMACAELAEALLRVCPQLTILATSREALGISGERPWIVPSLALPDPRSPPNAEQILACEAVRLFVERARIIRPDFTPTAQNAALLAEVCRRLDGIPLALELAAARLAALTLESLAARLDDSFRLLTGGSRTALPRRQTLRATLDWSHDLLSEPERVLLRRLSVFAGGWTLEAAEAVCAGEGIGPEEVLDLLAGLIHKSLVLLHEETTGNRYHLLETVRQYGQEKLTTAGEAELLRDRHLDWCLGMALRAKLGVGAGESAAPNLEPHEQAAGLERLEGEADNLRAALSWSKAAGERQEKGLRLAASIPLWWLLAGHAGEGRRWLEDLLENAGKVPALLQARALLVLCFLASNQGEYTEAMRLAEMAHALFQSEGDQHGAAASRYSQGVQAFYLGDYPQATILCEEVLRAYRALADRRGESYALLGLGIIPHLQADYGRAAALYTEGLALFRELGDAFGIGNQLANLANVARDLSDFTEATRLHRESLEVRRTIRDRPGLAECFEGLAVCAAAEGQPHRAARLLGAAEALREAIGRPVEQADRAAHDRVVPAVRAALGEDVFVAAWAEGQALPLEEAIAYAYAMESGRFADP